jgi:hypothetical protein
MSTGAHHAFRLGGIYVLIGLEVLPRRLWNTFRTTRATSAG